MQVGAFDQPEVGGNIAAGVNEDDVAGDQVFRVDLPNFAVASDQCARRCQLLEGGDCFFRLVLLNHADSGVQKNDQQDDCGVGVFADKQRDDRGSQQDVDQHVLQLGKEQGQ